MPILSALAPSLGKVAATKLIAWLANRPNGAQKLEAASAAIQKGATAIEALKGAFGDDFPKALNAVLGKGRSSFSYEAGTADYIKAESQLPLPPWKILRDELNINLDRLSFIETNDKRALKNHARGLFHVWAGRYQQLAPNHYKEAEATFEVIGQLLSGQSKAMDLLKLVGVTGLGGTGVILLVQGIFAITGTGVGILALISLFLFGIPWPWVIALVLGGLGLLVTAKKLVSFDDVITTCIQLAYRLVERQMATAPKAIQTSHQPTVERE